MVMESKERETVVEHVVDCAPMPDPHGTGPHMMPISIAGHVHERIIRCRDCYLCSPLYPYYCRCWGAQLFRNDGFCSRAVDRKAAINA